MEENTICFSLISASSSGNNFSITASTARIVAEGVGTFPFPLLFSNVLNAVFKAYKFALLFVGILGSLFNDLIIRVT